MNKDYYRLLEKYKKVLTRQQYNTFKGQIKAGDVSGFMKGFYKIVMGGK